MDLLQTLIPENLTAALSRNLVPAIVVFAVMFGAAVQSVQSKTSFLETVEAIRLASLKIWQWVVYLAPIGVFALFASTAGTIEPRMAGSLAVYLGLFLLGTFLLAFVLLPLALSAIVPIGWRETLADVRPAFVLALVTTLPTSALPLIQAAAERRIAAAGHADAEAKDVTRATISLAYVFASLGNYFVALFMIYASQHFRVSVDWAQKLMLPPITLLSASGAPSTTISAAGFMGQWLGLPSETVPLYVEAMTVTRYGQVALSVSAYAFIGFAVPFIYFRCAAWRPRRGIGAIVLALILFAGTVAAIRTLSDRLFSQSSNAVILDRTIALDLARDVPAIVYDANAERLSPIAGPATLDGIRDRGVLRVGYGRDIIPFTYLNTSGDLVGFDISFAYKLARDLHVRLELAAIDYDQVRNDLIERRLDIVMAGAYVTESRLEDLAATTPYFESPVALIARAAQAKSLPALQPGRERSGSQARRPAGFFARTSRGASVSQGANRANSNLRRVRQPPRARRSDLVVAAGASLGLGSPRIHGGCRKRHGGAAHVFLFPATRCDHADALSECVARTADGKRLSRCADRVLDRRQAARSAGATLELTRQCADPGLVASAARSSARRYGCRRRSHHIFHADREDADIALRASIVGREPVERRVAGADIDWCSLHVDERVGEVDFEVADGVGGADRIPHATVVRDERRADLIRDGIGFVRDTAA